MQALMISDLHLTPSRPGIARAFLSFLAHTAPEAQQLYILGDFFEYWVGDDAMEPFHEDIASALKNYREAGHDIYFMPGNRDFALGRTFLKKAGMTWLNDPSLVTLNGETVLLMHGDSLCTGDPHYLRYRRIIRNPLVINILRMTPLGYRKNLGRKIRENSQRAKQTKSPAIMDVTPGEVVKVMGKHQVVTMIHGHTHRPAIHDLTLTNGQGAKRYVLGDWEEKGWFIRADNNRLTLESFDIV
ncbi:UDP-2,3-diacylglucosamine diphosphatase [Candidatus Sororendozoicomonas aggregata]|uniref:UDP-2,3-diacylglucosamine diphosphatase n=1 Tax=Candidatus Sororendozoicomonas aggregata TaxID=3073239 RepID=UPI002ED35638